ncbi:unnamed protein product [Rotaria socialis]|uniref:N-acetyltransferase domain-containing protein n=2 Tax=Rotaria socialis TaxID=392032 RepID=A0A820ISG0_9BILA|nr:unnamed protein product [Rotaria socialis]CAF3565296.1 unnamed protein product [Rotaria socialis]CAF4312293.1 unnamed protein product [Rotaria socialis]
MVKKSKAMQDVPEIDMDNVDDFTSLDQAVFGPKGDGYFEGYFLPTASPNYREGDTLGAWSADNLLVSAVHIRRITLRSDNKTFLCGVVSNMATLAEFRNQGLSRRLLTLAIEKMEKEDFDLSILGTGRSNHYLSLGWEPITVRINYVINIPDKLSSSNYEAPWVSVSSITSFDQLHEFYSVYPRSYQFDRDSSIMFEHWIGWHWQEDLAYICVLPNERGYAIISQSDGKHGDLIQQCHYQANHQQLTCALTILSNGSDLRRLHPKPVHYRNERHF